MSLRKSRILLGVCLLVTACGTSPEPDYFSCAMEPGVVASSDMAVVIKVQRPALAAYLDRPDFVRQDGTYQLLIDETNNWAEPLDTMFARILAGDLQRRLPASTVLTEDNGTPADTRFTIDMTLQRFNLVNNDDVLLEGELIVSDKKPPGHSEPIPVQFRTEVSGSPSSIAEGLSELIAGEADQIAQRLVTLDQAAKQSQ